MSKLPKVMLIEDDPVTVTLIKQSLGPLIQVSSYIEGRVAVEKLDDDKPDVILLDLNLPDSHGIGLLKDIRNNKNHLNTPILIMTSSSSLEDEIQGHELGATEYLKKPLNPKIIRAVVEKNLASTLTSQKELMEFEGITVDLKSMTASINMRPIDLTQKELKILIYLMENTERVLSKEQIFEKVWKDDSDSLVRTVEMHISSLRKKLGDHADYLRTARGLGYSLKK